MAFRVNEFGVFDCISLNGILAIELRITDFHSKIAMSAFATLLVEFLQLDLSPRHRLSAFQIDEFLIDFPAICEQQICVTAGQSV